MGKTFLGLDYGEARVGLALADDDSKIAFPRGKLQAKPRPKLLADLRAFCKEESVSCIVVGLPLDMRGGEGDAARKVRVFAQELSDATALPIELWDERLTTVQAQASLAASGVNAKKSKAKIDEAAAVAILQSWIDRRPTGKAPR